MEQNKKQIKNWGDLFSLYRDLVGPFQEFEKCKHRKWELEVKRKANNFKEVISFSYKRIIRNAFSNTLTWAIPFLIVFYVIVNVVHVNGEKLLYYCGALTSELWYAIKGILFEEESAIFALVAAFIFCVPLPCLIFLFPLMIVRNVISEVRHISRVKKENEERLKAYKAYDELLPQAEAAIQEAWKKIAPFVNHIPPDYRNSRALAFFSNSFFNAKVKNLQEAVNLYDQYLHQQEMEDSQREIARAQIEAQRASMDAIDALSGQMAYMQEQIQDQIDSLDYHYY